MTWDALSSNSLHYVQSDVETRAFGVETARIIVGANAPDNLEMVERFSAIVSQASEHVLIVRWPAHLTSIGIALSQSGRRIYPADTLMYWDVATPDLTQHRTHRHDLDLLPLSEAGTSSAELERLVGEVFVHYVNHYSANPLLAHVPVARGYCDWVRRYVRFHHLRHPVELGDPEINAFLAHLAVAVVFDYEAFRFELWLAARNRKVQRKYWDS